MDSYTNNYSQVDNMAYDIENAGREFHDELSVARDSDSDSDASESKSNSSLQKFLYGGLAVGAVALGGLGCYGAYQYFNAEEERPNTPVVPATVGPSGPPARPSGPQPPLPPGGENTAVNLVNPPVVVPVKPIDDDSDSWEQVEGPIRPCVTPANWGTPDVWQPDSPEHEAMVQDVMHGRHFHQQSPRRTRTCVDDGPIRPCVTPANIGTEDVSQPWTQEHEDMVQSVMHGRHFHQQRVQVEGPIRPCVTPANIDTEDVWQPGSREHEDMVQSVMHGRHFHEDERLIRPCVTPANCDTEDVSQPWTQEHEDLVQRAMRQHEIDEW